MGGVCVFVFTSVSKLFCVSVACHYPSDKDTSLSHKILQNLIISTLQIHPAENLHLAFQDTEQFLECAILFSSILNTLLHHPHLPGKKKKNLFVIKSPVQARIILKDCLVSRTLNRSLLCTSPLPHISILHLSQLPYLILHETRCMLFTLHNTMSFTSRNVQKM